jgi:hypothetical protein
MTKTLSNALETKTVETFLPVRGPYLQLIRLGEQPDVFEQEAKQPDGSALLVIQIKWVSPKGNNAEDVRASAHWAHAAALACQGRGIKWKGYALVHGRSSTFLNLLLDGEGSCPLPDFNETLVCLSKDRFQYRFNLWDTIQIGQDPTQLKERYKIATLSKFEGGALKELRIPFVGMIQNLVLNHREDLDKFFS